MMHRSSGELSSGLKGAETARALAISEASSAPICEGPAALRLACSHHIHLHAVSSQYLVYASCIAWCRRRSELLDCETRVLLIFGRRE